jgi:acyl carrier protein
MERTTVAMVTVEELKRIMCHAGVERSIVDAMDPAKPLLLQGMDSIDYPVFALAVEEKFRVRISDRDALQLKTLDDFKRFIEGNR